MSRRAGSTGPGIDDSPRRYALETALAVIRLVADQHHQPVSLGLGLRERVFDQRLTDASLAKRRLNGKRTEKQGLTLADAHGRQAY